MSALTDEERAVLALLESLDGDCLDATTDPWTITRQLIAEGESLAGGDIAQSTGSEPIAKLDPEVLRLARKVGAAVLGRGLYIADFDSEEDVQAGNDCDDDARQLLRLLKGFD